MALGHCPLDLSPAFSCWATSFTEPHGQNVHSLHTVLHKYLKPEKKKKKNNTALKYKGKPVKLKATNAS